MRDLREALQRKRARTVHQYTNVFDRIVFSNPAWRRYFEATLPLDPTEGAHHRDGDGPRALGRVRDAPVDPAPPSRWCWAWPARSMRSRAPMP